MSTNGSLFSLTGPEDRCQRAESKLKQLEVIPDLEEELHHARQELEKAESSLERWA